MSSRNSISDHHEANLPPVDRGKHAYLFLAACFIFEALIWGMINPDDSVASSQDKILTRHTHVQDSLSHTEFSRTTTAPMSHSRVRETLPLSVPVQWSVMSPIYSSLPTTNIQQGISYMLLPVAFILLQAFPRMKLWAAPIGFIIMCLALSMSSFATTTGQLIVSQGVAYGIGASLAYAPTIVFMDDWFVQKRGLAFGIMWVSILIGIQTSIILD